MKSIRVTGKGLIKVHPDMTRILITLDGLYSEYEKTLKHSSKDTEAMKDLLVPFGFERSDLKTLAFGVEMEYESYKEKGTYKQRFIGYRYTHRMKVEFESDNQRLGKILYALAVCPLHPEFRLAYTVKDPEAVKNELLGKAVRDAVVKAGVLSSAAGAKLGEIQSIDYSWGEVDFEFRPMRDLPTGGIVDCCTVLQEKSLDLDIEPDDIEVQDTVTVVWGIA